MDNSSTRLVEGEGRSPRLDGPDSLPLDSEPGVVDTIALPSEKKLHEMYPAKFRGASSGASALQQFNIRASVGLNGGGKSLHMIDAAIPSLLRGRPVLSTVRITDADTGKDHPLYVPLQDWSQLLDAQGCLALFDEVQGIANSRASQGMPVQVQTFLHQLRRKDIDLHWTSPSWTRADLLLREVTRSVTVCRGYFPERRYTFDENTGERIALGWGSNRVFRWITYDAADFTEWTDSKEGQLKGKINTWYVRPSMTKLGLGWRKPAIAASLYDTLAPVSRVGEVLDSGACANCGGTRSRPSCSCDDYLARVAHSKSRQSVALTPRPLGR